MEETQFKTMKNPHDELCHYGIKGQKWGVRRYQKKDGTLTDAGKKRYDKEMDNLKKEKKRLVNEERTRKKIGKLEKLQSDVDDLKRKEDDVESVEQKRERLLKSTDAKELYENRDLLTTPELNERINRIDTEARLLGKISQENKQTGMEYVNSKLESTTNTINKANNFFRSVDSAYSSILNSSIGKTLAKKLGLEPPKKEFNLDDFWKNRNRKSTQELMDVSKRLTAEEVIRKKMKERVTDNSSVTDIGREYINTQLSSNSDSKDSD